MGARQSSIYAAGDDDCEGNEYLLWGQSSLVGIHHVVIGGTPTSFRDVTDEIVTGGEPYKDRRERDPQPQYRPYPCLVYTPINGVMELNLKRTVELSPAGLWTREELSKLAQEKKNITPEQAHELLKNENLGGLEARLAPPKA